MSQLQRLFELAKGFLSTKTQVDKNTEDIKEIRIELKRLSDLLQKEYSERQRLSDQLEYRDRELVLRLQNEVLKLENRLLSAGKDRDVDQS
jgi:chromosome segregation ATPase